MLAAYKIADQRLDGGCGGNRELVDKWFGKSREFLAGTNQVPLVNNVVASAVYKDQHGRFFAYADPADEEFDLEPISVPPIPVTDRLFVAIGNTERHDGEARVPLEGLSLPKVAEELHLTRIDDPDQRIMTVSVDRFLRPVQSENPRISSCLIEINGYVQVEHPRGVDPQALLEALLVAAGQ